MFTKELRFSLFCLIYQDQLALPNIEGDSLDYDSVLESIITEYKTFEGENINAADLQKYFELYLKNKIKFETALKVYLPNWSKTFELLRAVMLTFQTEKKSIKIADKDAYVVSYIKFAENYAVSSNVKMIHAVLSKVVDDK